MYGTCESSKPDSGTEHRQKTSYTSLARELESRQHITAHVAHEGNAPMLCTDDLSAKEVKRLGGNAGDSDNNGIQESNMLLISISKPGLNQSEAIWPGYTGSTGPGYPRSCHGDSSDADGTTCILTVGLAGC